MRRYLIILGLLGCLAAHAASPVWVIRGEHNTVYLAGSVHFLKTADAALPAAFDRAYAGSQTLLMELDLDSLDPMEAAAWMMEHGMLTDGATLKDAVGAARYSRIETEAERLGLPLDLLGQMKPWVLGMQLLELQYLKLGFDPAQGVEQQLLQRARLDSKEIRGLETLPEQLGAIDALSSEDQAKFLDLVVSEMHEVESETQRVVNAWRAGDTQKLSSELSDEYKRFPSLYRALVTERNKHWVPQIEQLFKDKRNYFVVVGALHLVGDEGLLQLLRRDGWKAEALN
jgi:uncharacterized protein YbaP (TraB family)